MKAFVKSHQIGAFVVLAYAISWMIQLPALIALQGDYHFTPTYLIVLNVASFGPSVAAILVSAAVDGWPGVKALLKRLLKWRVSWLIYLAAFFVFPTILFVCYQAFGIHAADGEDLLVFLTLVVAVPINAIISSIVLGIGPLGEELGWRGFMLPRLLERYGEFSSSILLGLVWAFWHLPVFLFPEWRGEIPIALAILLYPIGTMAIAYVMTILHRWTGGSVLIAILYHGVVNYAMDSREFWQLENLSPLSFQLIGLVVFLSTAVAFGILDRVVFQRLTPGKDSLT